MFKKILITLGVLIVLLLGTAIALPFIFKDDLVAAVRQQANESVNATVDFSDVSLSLFRHFPSLALGINDLAILGKDEFEGIPLLKTKQFDLALDFWSVVGGGNPLKIDGIYLDRPEVNIYVLKNGKTNYDIALNQADTSTTTSEGGNFLINLQEYAIENGSILYEDQELDFRFAAEQLDHSGSGNFTANVFDLDTQSDAAYLSIAYGGIEYLSDVKTNLDAVLNINLDESKYTLKDNELILNNLRLNLDGWLQLLEEDVVMDFQFKAPSNDFKELFSIIPQAYLEGYESAQISGTFLLDGIVKGTYNGNNGTMPSFAINTKVQNGAVKYTGAPVSIDAIQADIKVNSPSSDLNKMEVDIPSFTFSMGNAPFSGNFRLRTPISDPDIKTAVKGKIELDKIAKAMPMDGILQLGGMIDADFNLEAKMSQLDRGDYTNTKASGFLNFSNFIYQASDMPAIRIHTLQSTLSPQNLSFSNLDMKLGKSDLKGSGQIDNYLAYFSPETTMKGSFNLSSTNLDLNDWMEEEPANANTQPEPTDTGELFDRFQISLDGRADIITYDTYKLFNTEIDGTVAPDHVLVNNFSTNIGDNDIRVKGDLRNVFNYLFDNQTLKGDIDLSSNNLNLNELMGEETATTEDTEVSSGPVLVPENMDLTVNADLRKVTYTNLDLTNVRGRLSLKDEQINLKNVRANGLGGEMTLSGGYDTSDKEAPKFALNYNLEKLNFAETFSKVNTFAQLAPIGKFLQGQFTSTLSMEGSFDKDMNPVYSSLNADGFLATINSVLAGFKPIEKIAGILKMDDLRTMQLDDLKTWFEIKEGAVKVEEFPVKAAGLEMKVAGTHSLEQEMNYLIKAKIPKDKLGANVLNQSLGGGISALSDQAGKLGINIQNSPFLNLGIRLTGSISDPKVSVNLLGADGEPTDVVEQVKEAVEKEVEEKVEEVKEEIKEKVEETKEDLKAKADAEIKKVMDQARKTANQIKEKGYAVAEEARKTGYEQAAKLEREAGNNPLKKGAARIAADKLRKETDKKVEGLKRETDKQAQAVIDKAEAEAEKIREKYQNQ
jgi:hypothetical protein